MPNFPTIQSFFSPIPSSSGSSSAASNKNKYRDGFDDASTAPTTPWTPTIGSIYTATKIGAIHPGPGRITFTGRVANFGEYEKNSKSASAAKVLLRLTVMDETGAIDIKLWLTQPTPTTELVKLGALVIVHTTFVAALSVAEKEKSAANCMVSVSDTDSSAHVEFVEDSDENWADYRVPIGTGGKEACLEGLMPLKVFVESGSDVPGARLLVCVKWKGAKKQIPRKDGGTAEKRDVGIFDDTMEATLTLWGSTAASATLWDISKTILLITSPALKLWRKDVQLSLSHSTLVDIDPLHRDTQWLRRYAQKLLRKPEICQPFPLAEFEWREALYGDTRVKYTFADIDKYSRNVEGYIEQLPAEQCVGWLNVVIVEMNIATLYRRNMLLCGSCCGFAVFTNSFSTSCKKCNEPIASMLPNPNIIGCVSDETGCVSGSNLLWSERAWMSLLGRSVQELAESTSTEVLKYLDDFFLFTRINLAFGWDLDIGKIAVWDVIESS